jgi:RNA polymerase sigma-70 factor (ECF subfamily)
MAADPREEFLAATLPCLDLVYNLARRTMPDPQLVDDLVQETYVRAFEAWCSRRRPRRVEPWLATICLNAGRSYWRRASTRREITTEEVDLGSTSPGDVEDRAMARVRAGLVHEALWQLSDEQRIAITLMDLNGFSASEVARMTGSPRGTVLSRAHRGRKRLAQVLSKEVAWLET